MALYRKYRPATFAEVVGQEHVTDPLRTALDAGRISHAYLFSGPRGCGKTSSARILARSLNCAQGPTSTPCGSCPSCIALAPGGPGNLDVVELDAASHGGVDDTRELRDRAFYAPAESRYRVFIVDEAHMVTTAGFNALLKIVEEPPAHLIFVFATTEPDKVLPTIRSRTHHYPFRLLPPATMRGLLGRICEQENVSVEESVYPLVIRAGGGSPRDSLSVLDQLLAGAGTEGVTYARAVALLGVTDVALIDEAVDALAAADGAALFGTIDRVMEAGHDPRRFAVDLLERLRDLILLRAVPDAAERSLVAAPADLLERMRDQAARIGPAALTRYAELLHEGLGEMHGTAAPRLLLEVVCSRMLLPAASDSDAATLQRLERLEQRLAGGSVVPGGDTAPVEDRSSGGRQQGGASAAPRRRGAEALAAARESREARTVPDVVDTGAAGTARADAGGRAPDAERRPEHAPGTAERTSHGAGEGGGSDDAGPAPAAEDGGVEPGAGDRGVGGTRSESVPDTTRHTERPAGAEQVAEGGGYTAHGPAETALRVEGPEAVVSAGPSEDAGSESTGGEPSDSPAEAAGAGPSGSGATAVDPNRRGDDPRGASVSTVSMDAEQVTGSGSSAPADLLAQVQAAWGEIKAKARDFGPTVGAMLASGASVVGVEDDVIVFAHHAALVRRLSGQQNLEAVRAAVGAVLGRDYQVRWVTAGAAAPTPASAPRGSGTRSRAAGREFGGGRPGGSGTESGGPEEGGPRRITAEGRVDATASAVPRAEDSVPAGDTATTSGSVRGTETGPPSAEAARVPGAGPGGAWRGSAGAPRFSRPSRTRTVGGYPDEDIPPPDYPDLPDDPGPADYGYGPGGVPPSTPEEEREMLAESTQPVAPGDRRDPDEVALELLASELGATRLDS